MFIVFFGLLYDRNTTQTGFLTKYSECDINQRYGHEQDRVGEGWQLLEGKSEGRFWKRKKESTFFRGERRQSLKGKTESSYWKERNTSIL